MSRLAGFRPHGRQIMRKSGLVICTVMIGTLAWNGLALSAERTPIYDEKADARALIEQAVQRAKADDKHVLIQWGGNWCGWCYKLHDLFESNEQIHTLLSSEYELVFIDSSNTALAKSM